MQTILHYFLHFGFPFFIAFLFFRKDWKKVFLILIATMLVDLDHLFSDPIFEANRCSIGFHPLHTPYAIIVYIILLFFPKTIRLIGIGLLLHMLADFIDCIWLYQKCGTCLSGAPAAEWVSKVSAFLGL